jgi:hypothetical protein
MNQSPAQPATRGASERGLGYAFRGAVAVVAISLVLGGIFIFWFLSVTRNERSAALLPADTQLYAALAPNVSDVPDLARVSEALQRTLDVTDSDEAAARANRWLGVEFGEHIVTWLGSDVAIAVRGFDPASAGNAGASEQLLRNGDLLFLLASRNDPQANVFLQKHLEARAARGDTITSITAGETTIYVQEGGEPSPIAAFALVRHYIVFANRPEPIVAIAEERMVAEESLLALPEFQAYAEQLTPRVAGALYTDGSSAAVAAREALRDLLN